MKTNYTFITMFLCLSLSLPSLSFAKEQSDEFTASFNKEKTFIEKYLPWLNLSTRKEAQIDPTKTMQSPFIKNGTTANKTSKIANLYDLEHKKNGNRLKGLHIAHKSNPEIQQWISEAIGESFNFSLTDMNGFRGKISPYYSNEGIGEFKKLLLSMNTVAIMKSNNKKLASYVTDPPLLQKEGISNGAYTWLYDSYIIISYVDNSANSKNTPVINRKYRIRIKMSQTHDTRRHPEGMKIDTITAKKLKLEEGI